MFQRPTNRKKRKKLARLSFSKPIGDGAFVITMNVNSPSYRRMLHRQKKHIQYIGLEKWSEEMSELRGIIDEMQDALFEQVGIKRL